CRVIASATFIVLSEWLRPATAGLPHAYGAGGPDVPSIEPASRRAGQARARAVSAPDCAGTPAPAGRRPREVACKRGFFTRRCRAPAAPPRAPRCVAPCRRIPRRLEFGKHWPPLPRLA